MKIAMAATAAAVLALTSACAGDPDDVEGEGDGGSVLNMQIGEPRSLIPGGSGESEGFRIIKNVYEGLVYYDAKTGEPENLVAESITTEDNQTWTIKIKEGLKFHNGEPVNAAAFMRSWNRTAYAPNVLPLNGFFSTFAGYEEMNPEQLPEEQWADPEVPEFPPVDVKELSGVTSPDEYTIQVELAAPFASFATMLGYEAFFPVAEECLADTEACEKQPIGNGPFMFEEPYSIENGGTAVAWDEYQGDHAPSIDAVRWHVYLEGDDCWADFLTGDIDVCRPSAADYESAVNDAELAERRIVQDGTSIVVLGFPLYDETYQDVNLRHAISVAIDREGVLNVIGPDRYNPLDSWVPASILGGGQSACGEFCTYDPELATQLLEDAGGWPEGEKLRIWVNDASDNVDIFRAIGDSISQTLGIEYEIVSMDWPDYLAAREAHNLDGPFRDGWGPDYNLNENYLEPIYGNGALKNDNGFENEQYEANIAEAGTASTIEEAVELYQEAERTLAEVFPSAPIFVEQVSYFHTERVSNVIVHPIYSGPGGDAELRDIVINE
ncbi:peptide ABC transporter substrate-binding protein [Glycomyces arizonensis]|uniref:peptide ABC transporter substrate-binding protein n=1 Tax=Glycomyces arizonensis TaxID=256035 RepID=UPI001FE206B6|nr:ABC transporter substrate-binding protein [Glycomyces arizonensis]